MRNTIDWTAWSHHHELLSLCVGEAKKLTDEEVAEANRLIAELNERVDALNVIFRKAIAQFKACLP